jgi:hypothetical protein
MRRILISFLALLIVCSVVWGQIGKSSSKSTKMVACENYVRALYEDVFGREGDATGVKYHTDRLFRDEVTKRELVSGFLNGDEYREKFVKGMYGWFLDREPDERGLKYHMKRMKEHTERDMISGFVLGEEFWNLSNRNDRDWIENVYWTLFSRAPDASGHDYWTKQLNSGTSKKQMVGQMMSGPEYQKRYITFLYRWYFKREPDDTGIKYWIGQFGEMNERQIIVAFLTGEEYWNMVTR